MILKKVIVKGKENYEPIDVKEAIKYRQEDLVFTTEDDEDEYEEMLDNLYDVDLNKDEDENNIESNDDLIKILPFLEVDVVDDIFIKMIKGDTEYNNFLFNQIAPFVSSKCLSSLVNQYLEGKYTNIDISSLYPYLSKNDVKRIFNYKFKTIE